MHDGHKAKDSFNEVMERFPLPDSRYAPYVFWFFDQDLHTLGIKPQEMGHEMAQKGFNPGYAHARVNYAAGEAPEHPAVHPIPQAQWLSENWFAVMENQLRQAAADGVHFSFTDDFDWPSLQAGGRLVAEDETLKAHTLEFDCVDAAAGQRVETAGCDFAVWGHIAATEPASYVSYTAPQGAAGWEWNRYYCDQTPPEQDDSVPLNLAAARACEPGCEAVYHLYLPADGDYTVAVRWEDTGDNTPRACYSLAGHTVEVDQRRDAYRWNTLGTFPLTAGENRLALTAAAPGTLSADAVRVTDAAGREWILDDQQTTPRQIAYLDGDSLRVAESDAVTPDADSRVYRFRVVEHKGLDGSSIDYLQERTVERFIAAAWQPYFDRLGEWMGPGRPLNGIFSDHEGDYGFKLAWSDSVTAAFARRYGEDLRRILPLLIDRDTAGKDAQWRWRWYDTVSDLYVRSFHRLSALAAEHGLYYTIHTWEETLPLQAACVGDVFRLNRGISLPGTDALHRVCYNPHNFKDLQSVAELEGTRLMDEVMALIELQDYTPDECKRQANYLAAYGVSHVINHSVKMTRPLAQELVLPDFYRIDPCWQGMGEYTAFLRRVSYINSLGQAVADTLLLNPLDSMYVLAEHDVFHQDYAYMGISGICGAYGSEAGEINRQYGTLIRVLTRQQTAFLTADKDYVQQMTVAAGALCLRGYAFSRVIVPRCCAMDRSVAEKLRDFVRAGGALILIGDFPHTSLQYGRHDPVLEAIGAELCAAPGVQRLRGPEELQLPAALEIRGGGAGFLSHRRRIDGREFLFLCPNADRPVSADVTLRGVHGRPYLLRPETGEITDLPAEDTPAGIRMTVDFAPLEAAYLVVDPTAAPCRVLPPADAAPYRVLPLTDFTATVEQGEDTATVELPFAPVRTEALRLILRRGGPDDPYRPAVERMEALWGGETVAAAQVDTAYDTRWEEAQAIVLPLHGGQADGLRVITRGGLASCRVEAREGDWWRTVAEHNRCPQCETIHSLSYPAGAHPVTLTDWGTWPFLPERFAGTVTYETHITLEPGESTRDVRLCMEKFIGCARVSVNGETVGCRLFAPFCFPIGGALRPGDNRLQLAISNTIASNTTQTHGGIRRVWVEYRR